MHVIATAGHVDHGKSTLVRALTGMEPDRWAEERRRGMTIDLGFAWTTLPSGATVAFVDVPGHERFVPNMLAGVGPVPAALVVVAADGGWMPQSAEHLAALDALGVRYGLLAVTRSDLADPTPALAQARAHLAESSLGHVEAVAVSGATGAGLDELGKALDRLVARLPVPDTAAPVRLWVDRSFTIRGSGTVVTGTLGAGSIRVGDALELAASHRLVRVRGLQSLGAPAQQATGVARVAVNLRGVERTEIRRGDALVSPDRFQLTDLVDVRLHGDPVGTLPPEVTLHAGSAAVIASVRPLGTDTARLRLSAPLPLRIGDRALLRDPGRHHVAGGVTVLDVVPPPLRRRGAAAARAAVLSTMDGTSDEAGELRRRGLVRRSDLARMGVPVATAPVTADWHADPAHWAALRRRLAEEVSRYRDTHPLEPGAPVETLRQLLRLPDRALVTALVTPPLVAREGRISSGAPGGLPAPIARAVDQVRTELAGQPFRAPDSERLAALGLGPKEIGAAVRAGALVRIAEGVVLLPDALDAAVPVLAKLSAPFTMAQAREALGTTRRVAVPLLELLDRRGVTRRLPDDTRVLAHRGGGLD
ncbi:MAG: selenocysteine-specific translation elongation factor [Actinobacteria bacterium]|nr:MAG: selenocysteine-specific translation elongation factor [Actinomycetota bacterium]